MSIPEPKIALSQIKELPYTTDRINTSMIDRQKFHLWLSHIAKVLGVPDEGDRLYFYNVRTSIFLENYISEDELVGTMLV